MDCIISSTESGPGAMKVFRILETGANLYDSRRAEPLRGIPT